MRLPNLSGLMELFFPPSASCTACSTKLTRSDGQLLCAKCAAQLHLIPEDAPCPFCDHPHAARGCLHCLNGVAPSLSLAVAAYPHLGAARDLVHTLKYHSVRHAAIPLAEGMADALAPSKGEWDLLAPIPLHRRRQRERGFNQAELLAEAVAARVGLACRETLARTINTAQQAKLDAEGRRLNVLGAFRPREPMTGLRVLLIDDVRTTGSTAEAAASACLGSGAIRVGLLTATCTQ